MKYRPKRLKLVDYHDPILHHETQRVTFPLSDEDKHLIEDMKYSITPKQLLKAGAPWEAASGMAANQWGSNKSIFLYCPFHNSKPIVAINPSYEALAPESIIMASEETDWEGCFSVPLATGNVRRNLQIRIKYQNEKGETIEKVLEGYPARVWQHENDHLNGFLYDDPRHGKCLEKKEFPDLAAVDAFYEELRATRRAKT